MPYLSPTAMNTPILSFISNQKAAEMDIDMLFSFLHDQNFIKEKVISLHPNLEISQEEAVIAYIKNFYKTHQDELNESASQSSKKWKKLELDFWNILLPVFPNNTHKNYSAYISIFEMNPLVSSSAFQFYWKYTPSITVSVCAHELIHHLFYPTVFQTFWNDLPAQWKNEGSIQTLGEAISGLFINHSPLSKLIEEKDVIFPKIERQIAIIDSLWPFSNSWTASPQEAFANFLKEVWETIPTNLVPKKSSLKETYTR